TLACQLDREGETAERELRLRISRIGWRERRTGIEKPALDRYNRTAVAAAFCLLCTFVSLWLAMAYIGIDFGTSNSVVANFQYGQAEVIPNHEGQAWSPSVVTLRRDNTLAFGQEARENFDEKRSIRSIKRILGTPERVPLVGHNLRAEQIAVMLFSLLKKDA